MLFKVDLRNSGARATSGVEVRVPRGRGLPRGGWTWSSDGLTPDCGSPSPGSHVPLFE